jgi:SAM-dependent methyltransferase
MALGAELRACIVCGGALRPAGRKDGFDLVSCPTCGMLMRGRLPAYEDLEEIYAREYFEYRPGEPTDGYADYFGDAEPHRETARRRLAQINTFAPSRGKLLDVGAAAGFFVYEAVRAGWDAEGIDIAPHTVEWGRRELGVPLRVGDISLVDGRGAYEVVTMWDYIEHSLDPAGDLARSNWLLAPNGIVALSTGDIDSVAARISGWRWHLLTPRHHNFFFGAGTLVRLLDRSGFEVAWLGHPGSRYSIAHLAYKLDRMARTSLTAAAAPRIASSRLGRYCLPLNLFDIVTIVARKVREPRSTRRAAGPTADACQKPGSAS